MKTQEIVVIRPVETEDSLGNTRYDYATGTRTTYQGHLGAGRVQEYAEGRQTVVTQVRAQLPPEADVQSTDRIEAAGGTYEVTGVVPVTRPSTGKVWHVAVDMERAE